MLQNLHTHTTFCDGRDTPEEMIETAIQKGFDSLGFSSHAKTLIGDDCELSSLSGYKDEILRLRDKYKDKIEILFGTELDYYSEKVMPDLDFDYKICSVHYSYENGVYVSYDHSYEMSVQYIKECFSGDSMAYAKHYYEILSDMPNKIRGDFVGHFDLVTKFSEKHPELFDTESDIYRSLALDALYAVREKMEFFEVNTGVIGRGHRKMPYPAPFILDEMKKLDCKLIITSDCHNRSFLDVGFAEAREYVKAHGFDTVYCLKKGRFVGEKI